MDIAPVARKALRDALTQDCGFAKSYASELAAGKKTPSLANASVLEAQLGIPASSWVAGNAPMIYLGLAVKAAMGEQT